MPDPARRLDFDWLPSVLMVMGIVLIAASFLPFSSLTESRWTREDSQAFGHVSQEIHHPSRTDMSDAELAAHRRALQKEFESLQAKLERAMEEPRRWKNILLWSGAALAAVGGLVRIAHRDE